MTDNNAVPAKPTVSAIKGFNRDLTCRGFQYEVGKTYEQDSPARVCSTGFHAVLAPLDVFNYYPPAESVYHTVELEDIDTRKEEDSKVAGRKITVGLALGIPGLVKAHVEYVLSNVDTKSKPGKHTKTDRSAASSTGYQSAASSTGYRSAASSTGDQSAASSTGDRSAASSTGDRSAASSTGYQSAASSTGYRSAASSTGYRSAASSTGDRSAASSTGDRSAASSTGDRSAASSTGYQSAASSTGYRSAASSTGDRSAASSTGEESIAAVFGRDGKAKGAEGNWIVLTERDSRWHIVEVKAFLVDGKKVKADTFYKLVAGKAVPA